MLSLRVIIRLIVPLAAGVWCLAHEASPRPADAKVREKLSALPLRFEPNAGQWPSEVRFAARAAGYGVALTAREALVSVASEGGKPPRRIGVSFDGAAASATAEGLDPLPMRASYLLGNRPENWRTRVPQYARVRYREVYPGIDLVYYANGRELEYDFVLRPGADPNRIRMRFRGADRVKLTPSGDLLLHAGGSRLLQKRPFVYQEEADGTRREIPARYRMQGKNVARVDLGGYDASRPLVIDPVLQYASLIGGAKADAVSGVKIDSEGMVWVSGYVGDGSIPARGGAYDGEFADYSDIFVAKIDPRVDGPDSLLYFTYIGGDGLDVPHDMAVDEQGNVYLTGSTTSSNFPLGGFAFQAAPKAAGVADAFVLRLSPHVGGEYSLTYASYLGGEEVDEGRGIAVDAAGKIYIAGTTRSEQFPLKGAYQSARWGPQDAFVAKFDPDALADNDALVYSTYFGGGGYDEGRSIAVTPEGIAYVAGYTTSVEFPWAGAPYQTEAQGGGDAFLARVDASKSGEESVPYASYFGGSGLDQARKIILDGEGKVWLAGVTLSRDLPATFNAFQGSAPGGDGDAFIAHLDLDAPPHDVVKYLSYLGGSGGDVPYGLALDAEGSVWVTGYTLSRDFPVTPDAAVPGYPGGVNVFVTRIDPEGFRGDALQYSTYLGRTNTHVGYAIAAGPGGMVAIGGASSAPGIGATDNAAMKDFAGGTSDGFLVVLTPEP